MPNPYLEELISRADVLRKALFVLGRVDGVSQETYDGVQSALKMVEYQMSQEETDI